MKIISKRGRQMPDPKIQQSHDIYEILKCMDDPLYFIRNYIFVPSKTHGRTNFLLHPHHVDYVSSIVEFNCIVAMMPRQSGVTSLSLAIVLWESLFKPHHSSVVFAPSTANAIQLRSQFKYMYDNLPPFLKVPVVNETATSISFSTSRVAFSNINARALHGMTVNRLYIDSFGIAPNVSQNEIIGLMPLMSAMGTKIVVASTPFGSTNGFANLWRDACRGKNKFEPFKRTAIDLSISPLTIIPKIGERAWLREYMCEFV